MWHHSSASCRSSRHKHRILAPVPTPTPTHVPRNRHNPSHLMKPRMDNNKCCLHITNLGQDTKSETLKSIFSQFGVIDQVQIKHTEQTGYAEALVIYSKPPDIQAIKDHLIQMDDKTVQMRLYDIEDEMKNTAFQCRRTAIPVTTFHMGILQSPTAYISEWSTTENVTFILDYEQHQAEIYFTYQAKQYKLQFAFKSILGDLNFGYTESSVIFTPELKHTPRIWQQIYYPDTNEQVWERVIEIPLIRPHSTLPVRKPITPITPDTPKENINLGAWRTYRMETHIPSEAYARFQDILRETVEHNLAKVHICKQFKVIAANTLYKAKDYIARAKCLSFEVLYLLESAILSGQMDEYSLKPSFYETLAHLDSSVACGILTQLLWEKKRVWSPDTILNQIYESVGMRLHQQSKLPSHAGRVYKVLVSPTSLSIEPPMIETTHSVLRHFSQYADRFLRVHFVDENLGPVPFSSQGRENEAIYSRIFKTLQAGIQIGSRRFDFLAYSSSQLLEHGCWFFAPTRELTPSMIRAWIGDFSRETRIAPYAKMIGQCLAPSYPIGTIKDSELECGDDIAEQHNIISEGHGKISPRLAREIATKYDMKKLPSAFEFQLGGAKGVVSISNYLSGRKIFLRQSQIEFESTSNTLEIIRVSSYRPAYLNRQSIAVLSTLKIKEEDIFSLFKHMEARLDEVTSSSNVAISVLADSFDAHEVTYSMARMIGAGFMERKDPFLSNMLHVFRACMFKQLKKNAAVHVVKGACLMGVMDDTNTLEENQVFIQLTNSATHASTHIVEGETLVYRDPCLHPSGMRVVMAVDTLKLRHIHDVVVFSSRGHQSVPSMCSGGKLGGDNYTVIWDPKLIPKTSYSPLRHNSSQPLEVKNIQTAHIHKLFVTFVSSDILDKAMENYIAIADQSPRGVIDGRCSRLAELHQCTDFPNSGRPTRYPEDLTVDQYPDFMQKKDKASYISKSIIGEIFRSVDKDVYRLYQNQMLDEVVYDSSLWVPGLERYIAEARELKMVYMQDTLAHMHQYGIQTEAELISGYVVKWLNNTNHKSKLGVQQQAIGALRSMMRLWKKRFSAEFEGSGMTKEEVQAARRMKAAAWYYVTYHPKERSMDPANKKFTNLLGFAWVATEDLCSVAVASGGKPNVIPEEINEDPVNRFKMNDIVLSLQVISSSEGESDDDDYASDEEYRNPHEIEYVQ
ncbi:RNA dependent RNA polymerase-domain-containing protein [Spinellus fusiger]|nr:RNA dependent RNA polymerase-domain-containing protein [Spinellus fusiger]